MSSSPTDPSVSPAPPIADLIAELVQRWTDGECPPVEELFDQHPDLWRQPELAVQLICEEICLSEEHGRTVDPQEVLRRFPQWRDQLAVLLECHQLLQPAPPTVFPEVGDHIAGFHLLAELGRGLQGRVFLATQPSLADRPVVLKVTPCDGQEHLSLARLQHTYIAPLYLAQDEAERDLRLLCMPFFGGGPLSQILETMSEVPPARRTGRDVLAAVDLAQSDLPLTAPARGPARAFLVRADYVQAICWIGACLAEALHYAHERGLVHLDVKPSNVLLAADAQPMLLDFHLAQPPLTPDGPSTEWLGGTAEFMSPEQQAAFDALSRGRPIPGRVDHRSDILSMGRLLYEMLGGTIPEDPAEPLAPLRRSNPRVSAGLEDIINHCLSAAAEERYPDAGQLAADLRRHLIDQPLKGVPNRSWIERLQKRRRSNPQAVRVILLRLTVFVALGIAAVSSLLPVYHRIQEAEQALSDGQKLIGRQKYTEAEQSARHGRECLVGLPFQEHLLAALDQQIDLAREGQSAQELHVLADNLRLLFDAAPTSGSDVRGLAKRCRATWDARQRLATPSNAKLATQQQADLLDLAILWADLSVRLAASDEADAARREALQVLAEAETTFGPSPVLFRERQSYAAALGDEAAARAAGEAAERLAPRTAWEHYAIGRQLLHAGDLDAALTEFEEAVRLRPQDFWPNFARAGCEFRLHEPQKAVADYAICIALAPERAECYYNRGLASAACNDSAAALRDFDEALRLDPSLALAAFNRGVLHAQAHRHEQALADFGRALANGAAPAECLYQMALVHLERKDEAAARASLQEALQRDPGHRGARERLKQLGERGSRP